MITARLQIRRFDSAGGTSTFPQDVRRGLSSQPKFLLPKYFYDPMGTHLFEAICLLPEYYVTRAEYEILSTQGDSIMDVLGRPRTLVELGSGSSLKTRLLIEALLARRDDASSTPLRGDLLYCPIDISEDALARSAKEMLQALPGLRINAFSADYETALSALADDAGGRAAEERTLAIFLGSSIGNLDPSEARTLVSQIRGVLRAGDPFLLGADLKKPSEILVPAYDDALGVTAAFNLNLLVRINRELDGDFRLEDFRHRAVYEEQHGRIELYLESLRKQSVPIRTLDLVVDFERGELIHTENSYKYDLRQIGSLAGASGFELEQSWFDQKRRFSLNLLRATEGGS